MSRDDVISLTGRYWRQYPPGKALGYQEDQLELALDETVFLIVDVYGQRFDDDQEMPEHVSDFYQAPADDPIRTIVREKIVPARDAARRSGLQRVYLANYLSPGLSEGNEWRNMSIRTCGVDVLEEWQPPTPILEHSEIIKPDADEPLVKKQMYSGFFETHLDSVLRGLGARNLVVVGFDSRICLGTTVVDAMYRDYRVIVLRDGTHTSEYPETEEGQWANFMAIRFIESNVGYTATTDDFIAACDAVAAAGGDRKDAAA